MKAIKPFWGRVAVMDTPVDEVVRDSGLSVPIKSDDFNQPFRRCVVASVDSDWSDTDRKNACELIVPGTVVYIKHDAGVRIIDLYVIELGDILAYEEG